MKMYIYSGVLAVAIGIAAIDYAMKPKVTHSLECVLEQVIANQTGKVTNIKRQDAINNNYTYFMNVYSNGTLVVNDVDHYTQEINKPSSYVLNFNGNPQPNLRFKFTKDYDDVTFYVKKTDVQYEYECERNN